MAKTTYRANTYKNPQKGPKTSWTGQVFNFVFKDQKFQLILGVFLLISAFALLIAFTSAFFTGKADQSVVDSLLNRSIRQNGSEVENWLGLTGAVLAHIFIFKWFGIGSFVLIPILFLVGWRLAFKTELFSITLSLKIAAFIIFWTSLLLGTLTSSSGGAGFWGGGVGFVISQMLHALFGSVGTAFFVIFALLVFIVYFLPPPSQGGENFLQRVMREFQGKFSEISPKEAEMAKQKNATTNNSNHKTSSEKTKTRSERQKDIILEIQDDPNDSEVPHNPEDLRKTRDLGTRRKPRNKPANEKNTNIELEIDASMFEESEQSDNQADEQETKLKDPYGIGEQADLFADLLSDPQDDDLSPKNKENIQDDTPLDVTDEDAENTSPKAAYERPELYNPTLELSKYQKPSPELLDQVDSKRQVSREEMQAELEANKDKIVETLSNYGIGISQIKATIGPTVTLYEIIPEAGVRISKIKNLEDDIALSLAALGIRIIAPIPGKGTIGIEVPNKKREVVSARSVIESDAFQHSDKELPIVLGKSITNEIVIADLAKMPHLLMAGATGQGKSVGLNVFLTSLIYKKHPAELKFILIDPKKVELSLFNKIEKHFLAKLPEEEEAIITDTSKVVDTLNSLCLEMDNRYNMLKEAACRNIREYNRKFTARKLNPKKGHNFLPYIVLVIDELADLMMVAGKEVEQPIARLAQLARAVGIHLIVATQRPSVNVITGIIKANFPARLSFKVTSKIDSRTILDAGGAEQLVGLGDLLFSMGSSMQRLQSAFIDTHEVERICDHINIQQSPQHAYELPEFMNENSLNNVGGSEEDIDRDVLFEEAARIIVMHQQGSTSLLQRRLKLGYNRAGRIIDQLENAGIVGPFEGSKAREVLIPDEYTLERLLSSMDK